MTEAARLVDELTTLLYEPLKGKCLTHTHCQIVACGACRKKADKPESVVHDSDCTVYRLIRAEEANTAVIRANAEEIADLEDTRDELEARVNALTAQMECRNELAARIRALTAERDALRARAERAESALPPLVRQVRATYGIIHDGLHGGKPTDPDHQEACEMPSCRNARAALAAASEGEGQGE